MKINRLKEKFLTEKNTIFYLSVLVVFLIIFNEKNIYLFSSHLGFDRFSTLALFQRIFCYASLFGFLILYRIKKRDLLRFFFLSVGLVYIFYVQRFLQPYLFQDDYYHYLAIVRADFLSSLFIPFVDHVSPIWRIVQAANIYIFGSYYAIASLPFVGAVIVSLSATCLYHYLKANAVRNSFLIAMLMVCYPGYRSILFWVSTNAIALSSMFGIISLATSIKILKCNRLSLSLSFILFASLCCSFFSWTTGVVYPIYLIVFGLFNLLAIHFFGVNESVKKVITIILSAVASLLVFVVARVTAYFIYSPEFVEKLLWLKNGLEHGYEKNLFRPFLWPFFSVLDGLILDGGFQIVRDNENFLTLLGGGLLFFFLTLLVSLYFKSRYIIFAYIFSFLSFAVVFVKRGIGGVNHRTPHGYLDYALSNNWYRISALCGALFLMGIALNEFENKLNARRLKCFLLFVLLCFTFQSLRLAASFNSLSERNLENSQMWRKVRCMYALGWSPEDFYYAAANIFAPMRGANPGGYWLGYEPSWFDMKARGNHSSIVFSQKKVNELISSIELSCGKSLLNSFAKAYSFSNDVFDVRLAKEAVPLSVLISNNSVDVYAPKGEFCTWGRFQLLDLELSPSKDNVLASIELSSNPDIKAPVKFEKGNLHLSFDLRSLPVEERCTQKLSFTVDTQVYKVKAATAIRYLE